MHRGLPCACCSTLGWVGPWADSSSDPRVVPHSSSALVALIPPRVVPAFLALIPIHPMFRYAVLGWFSMNNQLCSVCVACSVVCSCCYVVWYFLDLNWSVMNFLVLQIRLICMVTHLNYSWIWMLRVSSFVIYYLDSSFSPLCESRNEPMWVLDILGNAFTFWATSCLHFVICWAYEC